MLIVMTTVTNEAFGAALATKIVEAKLAACVQILPPMTSVYIWQGQVQRASEHLLLIKTLPEKFDELSDFIKANHSYDVPEILAVESSKIAEPYHRWLHETLTSGD